jgi:tartrate dehydratase beta subunit/fumarate hydratase class I family protein
MRAEGVGRYNDMTFLLIASMMLATTQSPLDHTEPAAVTTAAVQYLDSLVAACPGDPECMQKFQFGEAGHLKRAVIGEPWAAFVLTYKDLRENEFQDILRVAQFNYYACPVMIDQEYKGVVRVCTDKGNPGERFWACGSRGPTRIAEVNTHTLTLAPESDSLQVICVLTVQNNARYIVVKQGEEYFAIAGSDQAAELIRSNVAHVSRMTMFPLSEALYKVQISAKQKQSRSR